MEVAIFIIVELMAICFPKFLWWWQYGAHIKDAEPDESSIKTTRIIGIVLFILTILGIILGWD